MEDSWRVEYRQSERTALSKTIIWCIIHTVSTVSPLLPPAPPCLYVSVCLPHSGLIQSPAEAMMKPSALHHTRLPSCSLLHISMIHSLTVPFKWAPVLSVPCHDSASKQICWEGGWKLKARIVVSLLCFRVFDKLSKNVTNVTASHCPLRHRFSVLPINLWSHCIHLEACKVFFLRD